MGLPLPEHRTEHAGLVALVAFLLLIVEEVEKVEVKYIDLCLTIWPRAPATNQCFSLSNAHMKVGDRYRFNNGYSTKSNILGRST